MTLFCTIVPSLYIFLEVLYLLGNSVFAIRKYTLPNHVHVHVYVHEWETLRGLGGGEEIDGTEEEGFFVVDGQGRTETRSILRGPRGPKKLPSIALFGETAVMVRSVII